MTLLYLGFIIRAIKEPLSPLRIITKEEMAYHEYDRITISDTRSHTFESDNNSEKSSHTQSLLRRKSLDDGVAIPSLI